MIVGSRYKGRRTEMVAAVNDPSVDVYMARGSLEEFRWCDRTKRACGPDHYGLGGVALVSLLRAAMVLFSRRSLLSYRFLVPARADRMEVKHHILGRLAKVMRHVVVARKCIDHLGRWLDREGPWYGRSEVIIGPIKNTRAWRTQSASRSRSASAASPVSDCMRHCRS
ncbi:hypothetical protein X748_04260 [Mesorhizobium sp. LNJC386A00]|nr:hypothetical protein X752_22825 [Mesorhizobium sp. LNJC398B00]ESY39147.1 hypothetical protein X748_04260 [Mesorhizobium sp. LNJC386A00]